MPPLLPPLTPAWRRALRLAVLHHASSEHRRRHPALLHVGRPEATQWIVPGEAAQAGDPDDHALRVDILAALLRRARIEDPQADPLVWLTRSGELDLQDLDARWLAAGLQASAEAGTDLTLVIVDRHGWRDPRTGTQVRWKRLRQR